jgi:hypothetical protein
LPERRRKSTATTKLTRDGSFVVWRSTESYREEECRRNMEEIEVQEA